MGFGLIIYIGLQEVLINHIKLFEYTVLSTFWSKRINFCLKISSRNLKLYNVKAFIIISFILRLTKKKKFSPLYLHTHLNWNMENTFLTFWVQASESLNDNVSSLCFLHISQNQFKYSSQRGASWNTEFRQTNPGIQ